MASSKARLDRYTLFVDDNDNDRNLKPLPLANNHENSWFPQPDDTTADTELVRSHTVQAGQKTVQTLSLLGSSTVKPHLWLDIPITSGSLWNKYKRIHKRNLGGLVIAVLELPAEKDDYLIRKLSVAEDEVLSFRKRWLFHENLCKTHEVFEDSGKFYCVMEPAVVTLRHVCRCPKYPNEEQLVAITKQMLTGISYLSSQNLFHSLLNIDNVVINSDAIVKITKLEYCKFDESCSPKNTEAFGRTTMMLMNKFAHEKGEIAVRQPHEWSEKAVDFLSSTTTWMPDALMRHDFMRQEWKLEELRLHVLYVQGSADMN
ncbi:CAMK family protein kinase [Pyrenophora tritici-repentis]|nr:CAMK family protein kinase [Pyrenophora tritici-repentis]KAI0606742.1 CAMK family protein kinase [Pyrenophora tritici-repentis]KAI0619006.1 CAMK family protein kinase [Pyrenophora tritici-repentis]